MKRASIYRRWTSGRLARELALSLRRASAIADEIHKREQEADRLERRQAELAEDADRAIRSGKAKTVGEGFELAHRARRIQ